MKLLHRTSTSRFVKKTLRILLPNILYYNIIKLLPVYRRPFSQLPISPVSVRTVIDIGANRGTTVLSALLNYKDVSVHCFEPSKENFSILTEKFQSYTSVHLHHTALGSKPSEGKLLNYTHSGASTLSSSVASDHYFQINTHLKCTSSELVAIQTLDSFRIPQQSSRHIVDIIKIDVEGSELEVLQGSLQTLRHTRYLLLELSVARNPLQSSSYISQIFSLLHELGFYLYSVHDISYNENVDSACDLMLLQLDALFRNSNL